MQEKSLQIVDLILQRVKLLADVETDIELSELFEVKPGTISAWRKRNSMNYDELIKLCQQKGWDLNYILTPFDGNLNGNPNGNLKPKVHNKVTIKDNQSKNITGQTNHYSKKSSHTNHFVNEDNADYLSEIEILRDKLRASELYTARLEGQIELLKSLLNK
jgi:hypothetical protein